jgi:predicted transcriptional regulator
LRIKVSVSIQAVAIPRSFRQISRVSDKQLALESIQRLPADASLQAIAERLEFLAGIRKGLDQIERGETVPHEEVKRQLATWLAK